MRCVTPQAAYDLEQVVAALRVAVPEFNPAIDVDGPHGCHRGGVPGARRASSDRRIGRKTEGADRRVPRRGPGDLFPPATKTVPKEMLPIVDKPLIQYAVDEAIEAVATPWCSSPTAADNAVADYFDKAYELEQKLERAGKAEQPALVRNVLPEGVRGCS